MSDTTAARYWRTALAAWRIPDEILAQAPTSPWILPLELFRVGDGGAPDSPSRRRALEALLPGGSVLDVGCGGGRAAFALVPPAARVVGVDSRAEMLQDFARTAERRGVEAAGVLGEWPAVTDVAPTADVVVCHHVAYNVPDLAPFSLALDSRARRRVVLELPELHPLSYMAPLWRHFWDLDRPHGPTASDAAAVLREAGLDVRLELWVQPAAPRAARLPWEQQVAFARTRLCLTPDRDAEVSEALRSLPDLPRRAATLWWDRAGGSGEGAEG